MNLVLTIARYQYLIARRSLTFNYVYGFIVAPVLFGAGCFFLPFNYLVIGLSVLVFFMLNVSSRNVLRATYELDVSAFSIYPFSMAEKFRLLMLVDLFHINGLLLVITFITLLVFSIIRFTLQETLLLFSVFIIYWIFFTALFLCLRTFSRRNFSYYYVIRASSSIFVFAYFLFIKRKSGQFVVASLTGISPVHFVLYSTAAMAVLYFALVKWFSVYTQRHPFADPQLAQKFTGRWQ